MYIQKQILILLYVNTNLNACIQNYEYSYNFMYTQL